MGRQYNHTFFIATRVREQNGLTQYFVEYTTISMVLDRLNPKESLGFLSWKVSRILTNGLGARFAKAGLTVTVEQWRVLLPVYAADGLSQGRLCEILYQEKTGVSRLVAALEKQGLVQRKACIDDKRVKYIFITEAGLEIVDRSLEIVADSGDRLVEHIDPEELAVCKRVLWEIILPFLGEGCVLKNEG